MARYFYLNKDALWEKYPELSHKSIRSLSYNRSDKTLAAYESDWNDFCDWCIFNRRQPFPADPSTIADYLNDLAASARPSTIRRRVSALSENFCAAGIHPNPCKNWRIHNTLFSISKAYGKKAEGKTPLYWDDLKKIIDTLDEERTSHIRDKAILLTGFMGALQRSELSALDLGDIRKAPHGIIITIRKESADLAYPNQKIGIPEIDSPTYSAIIALRQWFIAGKIKEGPFFCSLLRNGTSSFRRLSDKSINAIVKNHVERIDFNPDHYGASSLRSGFKESAINMGIPKHYIKMHMQRDYSALKHPDISNTQLFINNPISQMFHEE